MADAARHRLSRVQEAQVPVRTEITVDGVAQPRPVSVFSDRASRPAS